jgi:hypothetical protein
LPGGRRTCYDAATMNRFAAYFFHFWFPTPQAVGRK